MAGAATIERDRLDIKPPDTNSGGSDDFGNKLLPTAEGGGYFLRCVGYTVVPVPDVLIMTNEDNRPRAPIGRQAFAGSGMPRTNVFAPGAAGYDQLSPRAHSVPVIPN